MRNTTWSRRSFIGAIGALGVGASVPALSSCGSDGDDQSNPTGNGDATPGGAVALPTFRAFDAVPADLPPDEFGTMAGFLSYPRDSQVTWVDEVPGGAKMTFACQTGANVPPQLSENTLWQNLNEQLGVELDLLMTPRGEYDVKFQTIVAGGDIPDGMQVRYNDRIPRIADLLEAKFQELSEFVGGDAALDYPSLAAIETASWRNCIFNGGIYGIPIHRGLVEAMTLVRQDIADELGVSTEITSGEEFREMCRALTDEDGGRWAIPHPMTTLEMARQMTGAPNVWGVEGGSFTHMYETDEMRRALDFVAQLWAEGLCHPDSFSQRQVAAWMLGGITCVMHAGQAGWLNWYRNDAGEHPEMHLSAIRIPKFDGGGFAPINLGEGMHSFLAIKQASKERIEEILSLVNYLASPFGTTEYLANKFGVEGEHFNWDGNEPVLTDKGLTEVLPTGYIAAPNQVLYSPTHPDAVQEQYDYQKEVMPTGIPIPTLGLYSETEKSEGGQLDTAITGVISELIQGRQTLSEWDEAVKQWKQDGGDKIRAEFEEAYAQANG